MKPEERLGDGGNPAEQRIAPAEMAQLVRQDQTQRVVRELLRARRQQDARSPDPHSERNPRFRSDANLRRARSAEREAPLGAPRTSAWIAERLCGAPLASQPEEPPGHGAEREETAGRPQRQQRERPQVTAADDRLSRRRQRRAERVPDLGHSRRRLRGGGGRLLPSRLERQRDARNRQQAED